MSRPAGEEHAIAERTDKRFGWTDPLPTSAHEYIVPSVIAAIDRFAVRQPRRAPLRIVDIGCGNGYVTSKLAALGYDVTGIDAAEDGIQIASSLGSAARFLNASVYDQDLPSRVGPGADCVISLEVVEHLFRPAALFEAASRILRPGGLLIVSTPYHGYLKNLAISIVNGWDRHFDAGSTGAHIKFFSRRTLTDLASQARFRELQFRGVGRASWLWKSMLVEFESGI